MLKVAHITENSAHRLQLLEFQAPTWSECLPEIYAPGTSLGNAVSWHPRQNRKAKFDRWHPWKLRKLVPLRCRLLKGVHLDLSNSATKCNQSWAADFLPSSWRTRKNTLILLACNRINKKHTKTAKTASDFSHKTSIAWHPRHHESIGPLFNLTAKVEVQLPVYDLPKALGFAPSIYIYIYTYVLMSVKICENAGTPNHSSSAWLSLVEIQIHHPAHVCACHVKCCGTRNHNAWNATASCWTHSKYLPQIPLFSFHWPRNYPNNITQHIAIQLLLLPGIEFYHGCQRCSHSRIM